MHEVHAASSPTGKLVSFIYLCCSSLMLFLYFIFFFPFVAFSMRVGPVAAVIPAAAVLVGESISLPVRHVATISTVAPPIEAPSSLAPGGAAAAELLRTSSPSRFAVDPVVVFSHSHRQRALKDCFDGLSSRVGGMINVSRPFPFFF